MLELALAFIAGFVLSRASLFVRARRVSAKSAEAGPTPPVAEQIPPPPPTVPQLAAQMEKFYEDSAHPQDLESHPDFQLGVAQLADVVTPLEQVVNYCLGANSVLAAMAAAALAQRADSAATLDRIIMHLPYARVWTIYYLLRYLDIPASQPIAARVLRETRDWWPDNALMPQLITNFIDARCSRGDTAALSAVFLEQAPEYPEAVEALLKKLTTPSAAAMLSDFGVWKRRHDCEQVLHPIGRLWQRDADLSSIVIPGARNALIEVAVESIGGNTPAGVLVVGDPGAGKSTLVRLVATRLQVLGWNVFQASSMDLMAGQTFIGELEKRLRDLLEHLDSGRRLVWYIPEIHEMVYAGQHRQSPVGVMDMLLPAIESGRLRVIGELSQQAMAQMFQQRPRIRGAFRSITLDPLSTSDTLPIAQHVIEHELLPAGMQVTPTLVGDALELARHYLSTRVLPGSAIELLRKTLSRLQRTPATRVSRDDLFESLTALTGLPREVLDDSEGLDATGLRTFFATRVMGQREAVQCLIDRVAMFKAGLTDPMRPVGVFLFAGPTGTGKTEVAKNLAEYLFGATERMIRLDMSEFQVLTALPRMVGEAGVFGDVNALTSRIRRQPFSVVLLDEFEKAHPQIWDLFLQVFDDGCLTDANGALADFRHSIIILTTNLGAVTHQGSSLGFTDNEGAFSEVQVTRAISQAFRPEFVNRLDRIVVFHPLTRAVMREILKKELDEAATRRKRHGSFEFKM